MITSVEITKDGGVETVPLDDNMQILSHTSTHDALGVALGAFLHGIDVAEHEAPKIFMSDNISNIDVTLEIEGKPKRNWSVQIDAGGAISYKNAENITRLAKTMLKRSRNVDAKATTFPLICRYESAVNWTQSPIPYMKVEEGAALGYENCLNPNKNNKDFLSWFKTMEDRVRKFDQDSDKALLTAFKETLYTLFNDIFGAESAPSFVHNISFDFEKDDMAVSFMYTIDDIEIYLFSEFTPEAQNFIGLVADLTYRCLMLNPHLGMDAIKKTPGIVLIDKIDMYFTNKVEHRFIREELKVLLKDFPLFQFIASCDDNNIASALYQYIVITEFKNFSINKR